MLASGAIVALDPFAAVALTLMSARLVVPSFVGGVGTTNMQVLVIPTTACSAVANSSLLATE